MGQTLLRPAMVGEEDIPYAEEVPTFDPHYGFKKPRKERVAQATVDEMRHATIPTDYRDYCAHKLINVYACQKKYLPAYTKCRQAKHEYMDCMRDDYLIRMMEVERERRLRLRRKRKALAQAAKLEEAAKQEVAAA